MHVSGFLKQVLYSIIRVGLNMETSHIYFRYTINMILYPLPLHDIP